MPIFEYICKECKHHFEAIVLGSQTPRCPKCDGRKLDQQLSRFAVAGDRSSASQENAGGACGTCGDPRGPGACSLDEMN